MLAYNYPWPSIFNCSQFPEDNGFCIKPSDQLIKQPEFMIMTTAATTVKPAVRVESLKSCHGCSETRLSGLKPVVQAYCASKIALRARVGTFAPSQFNLNNHPLAVKHGHHHHHASGHVLVVPRRDRRFFKGRRIVFNTAGPFLTEANLNNYFHGRSELDLQASESIDLYVLSEAQLALVNNTRKRMRLRRDMAGTSCRCRVFERVAPGRRFFITANVVRVKKSYVKKDEGKMSSRGGYFNEVFLLNKRNVHKRVEFLRRNFRMLVVTGVFGWRRVRPFIEYLENSEGVDLSGMCGDVERTVAEIEKKDAMYF